MTHPTATGGEVDVSSIVALVQDLVRSESRGGIDDYRPVTSVVEAWMRHSGLMPVVLRAAGQPVAVTATVRGRQPGPHYVLDACLDTADIGDPSAWSADPFSGDIEDGWLYGRGSSDSKAAVSIFCHVAARLAANPSALHGRVSLLFDLDEHTGGFGGIRAFLDSEVGRDVAGMMIGYPGPDKIVTGGRGFLRAVATLYGKADHSASTRPACNAITKAGAFVASLEDRVPTRVDPEFGLPPKVTVTSIRSGTSGVYSVVPDRAEVEVDVRLTPSFTAEEAWDMLDAAVRSLDIVYPAPRSSEIWQTTESWPPFRLPDDHQLVTALRAGARAAGLDPTPSVAGPSNIGNLLASVGIPATAGFGVRYRNLHGTDEAIEVASIPAVFRAYEHAVRSLLSDRSQQRKQAA